MDPAEALNGFDQILQEIYFPERWKPDVLNASQDFGVLVVDFVKA